MTTPDITAIYERQRNYAAGTPEGSLAIAYGRTAGLALQVGDTTTAADFWGMMKNLPSDRPALLPAEMPTPEQFKAAYDANPQGFAAFADPAAFAAEGSPLGNAVGSYAFAVDYARRGKEAIQAGGDPKWIAHWGAEALKAAGFALQAPALVTRIERRASERQIP